MTFIGLEMHARPFLTLFRVMYTLSARVHISEGQKKYLLAV